MIKILSPVTCRDELAPLAEAGADEFFLGYLPAEKIEISAAWLYMNRRPVKVANFTRIDDLRETLAEAGSLGKPVYITFNEHFYTKFQYDEILATIAELELERPNGVIAADIGLMILLKKNFPGTAIVASTGCPVFNRRTIAFYKELGVGRITLSVALKAREVESLAREASLAGFELECFIKNENCINTNALCCYLHGWMDDTVFQPFCEIEKTYSAHSCDPASDAEAVRRLLALPSRFSDGCGACFLPRFIAAGVTAVKIDGRVRNTENKIRDVAFIRKIIGLAAAETPPGELNSNAMESFRETYLDDCKEKCIYS